jgi:spore coat protein CotH
MKNWGLDLQDEELFGIKKLALKGKDTTFFKYPLQYALMRSWNLYHQRGAYTHLFINKIYYGMYYLMEEHDKVYTKSRFLHGTGNLYKCSRVNGEIVVIF